MGAQARADLDILLAEASRRTGLVHPALPLAAIPIGERVRRRMFAQQAVASTDPAKRKTLRCSRRAGKTEGIVADALLQADRTPDAIIPYVTLTRKVAKRIFWRVLKTVNHQLSLGLTFNETDLTATLPNGSQLWAVGADKRDEIDKMRGSKYPIVYIDEAQAIGSHLEELVEEVIEPATMDYDGQIVLAGTPNAACAGMFFEADTGIRPGWSRHHWTLLDNPHLADPAGWLERRRLEKAWGTDHPVYLREWCGQWVRSLDSLVYRFDPARNVTDRIPIQEYGLRPILGVDLGYHDDSAFQVVWFSEDHPTVYFGEGTKRPGMLIDDIAGEIRRLQQRWGDFARIVVDTGGLGKTLVEEIKVRHGLPLMAAEKQRKHEFIELLNSDLVSGRAQVLSGAAVIDEWQLLQWDEDRRHEDERFNNHIADAALYSWREAKHWLHEPVDTPPAKGTEAYFDKVAAELERQAQEEFIDRQGKEWWER